MLPSLPKIQYLILPIFLLQVTLYVTGKPESLSVLNVCYTIVLGVLLVLNTKLKGRFHKRVFYGLIISALGMIYFLMFQPRNTTVFSSLVFFVLPQIFYINAFYLDFKSAPQLDKHGARIAIVLAFAISIAYYMLLRKELGILKLPVMIGIFMTSLLFMMAAFRNLRVNKESFRLILAAVLCYMVAEGTFAYHSFAHPIAGILLVYSMFFLTALHLLVLGTISRKLIHTDL